MILIAIFFIMWFVILSSVVIYIYKSDKFIDIENDSTSGTILNEDEFLLYDWMKDEGLI